MTRRLESVGRKRCWTILWHLFHQLSTEEQTELLDYLPCEVEDDNKDDANKESQQQSTGSNHSSSILELLLVSDDKEINSELLIVVELCSKTV
jgi:hypothetical protein